MLSTIHRNPNPGERKMTNINRCTLTFVSLVAVFANVAVGLAESLNKARQRQ